MTERLFEEMFRTRLGRETRMRSY